MGNGDAEFELPVYGELAQRPVREELGLTVAQESRLRDISSQYQKQRLSLVEEAKALASSEYQRKLLEFERRDAEITAQVRQKLNALLSARQLAGLEKIAFYNRVASTLWDSQRPE